MTAVGGTTAIPWVVGENDVVVEVPGGQRAVEEEKLFHKAMKGATGFALLGGTGPIPLPSLPVSLSLRVASIVAASRIAHGWVVRKDAIGGRALADLRGFLTTKVPPGGGYGGVTVVPYPLYRENAAEIILPRPMGVLYFGTNVPKAMSEGGSCDADRMRFSPDYPLFKDYPPQVHATQQVLKRWRSEGSAILGLPCGFGKTACAIWLSTEGARNLDGRPRKVAVIVQSEKLMYQWASSYQRFAPRARVKMVQGQNLDYSDCDVCLAMEQTISNYLKAAPTKVKPQGGAHQLPRTKDTSAPNEWGFWSEFALVIVDEVHHIAAPRFAQVSSAFNCRRMLGLSATPDGRGDKNHHGVVWLAGQVAFRMRRDPSKDNLTIQMVHVDLELRGFPKSPILDTLAKKAAAQAALCESWERNVVLASIVVRLFRQGRMIFVLTERRAQIVEEEAMASCLVRLVRAIDPAAGAECGLLVGSMTPAQQDAALTKKIVFATFPMAEEGLDCPAMDTLVMAMPKTNAKCLEQSIGRIVRLHERKKVIFPMMIDLVDDRYESLSGRGHVRRRIYEEVFGYKVCHHDWDLVKTKFPRLPPTTLPPPVVTAPTNAKKRKSASSFRFPGEEDTQRRAPAPKRRVLRAPNPAVAAVAAVPETHRALTALDLVD